MPLPKTNASIYQPKDKPDISACALLYTVPAFYLAYARKVKGILQITDGLIL